MIVHIHEYIAEVLEAEAMKAKDLAKELDLTAAMVGQYKLNRGYNPSLHVAKKIYLSRGVVLHPYSEESLKWEIKNEHVSRI